ncbi:hypothetical protein MRB53_040665 [Persea americana]|nr:hypothetical protein MRB53_040665 [Persea americana]
MTITNNEQECVDGRRDYYSLMRALTLMVDCTSAGRTPTSDASPSGRGRDAPDSFSRAQWFWTPLRAPLKKHKGKKEEEKEQGALLLSLVHDPLSYRALHRS